MADNEIEITALNDGDTKNKHRFDVSGQGISGSLYLSKTMFEDPPDAFEGVLEEMDT